jgi:hypothetical protein
MLYIKYIYTPYIDAEGMLPHMNGKFEKWENLNHLFCLVLRRLSPSGQYQFLGVCQCMK